MGIRRNWTSKNYKDDINSLNPALSEGVIKTIVKSAEQLLTSLNAVQRMATVIFDPLPGRYFVAGGQQ